MKGLEAVIQQNRVGYSHGGTINFPGNNAGANGIHRSPNDIFLNSKWLKPSFLMYDIKLHLL